MAEGAEKWKALAEERKAELDDANSTRQQLEREIDQTEKLLRTERQQRVKAERELADLKLKHGSSLKTSQDSTSKLLQELEELKQARTKLQSRVTELEDVQDELERTARQQEMSIQQLEEEVADKLELVAMLQGDVEELQDEKQHMQRALNDAQDEVQQLHTRAAAAAAASTQPVTSAGVDSEHQKEDSASAAAATTAAVAAAVEETKGEKGHAATTRPPSAAAAVHSASHRSNDTRSVPARSAHSALTSRQRTPIHPHLLGSVFTREQCRCHHHQHHHHFLQSTGCFNFCTAVATVVVSIAINAICAWCAAGQQSVPVLLL